MSFEEIKRKYKPKKEGLCLCGHPLAYHLTNGCTPEEITRNSGVEVTSNSGNYKFTCKCRQFVDQVTKKKTEDPFFTRAPNNNIVGCNISSERRNGNINFP